MLARRDFTKLGLSVVGAALLGRAAGAQEHRAAHERGEHHELFQSCAQACGACQRACDDCAAHCTHLIIEGHKDHATTLATCQDCANFCVAAAQIVARSGPFAALICESCAVACERCAVECEKFPDDEVMQACAEECRKCEKACKSMLSHIGHAAG
jgi:hypothetical protein